MKHIKEFEQFVNESKKRFYQQDGIGKAKYTISYHDGKEKHKDGSDFYGIKTFSNKQDLEKFRAELLKKGYREDSGYKKESVVNESKFNVDDLVYNKRTKTVGIVRMADDKYGEVKTDADGNVSVDELEKYNPVKFKHQSNAKVAPSTEKEVNKRGLFNPFKLEENKSLNEAQKYDIEAAVKKIKDFNRGAYKKHKDGDLEQLALDILDDLRITLTGGNVDDTIDHLGASMDDDDRIPEDRDHRDLVGEIYGIASA